ncbi:MAG: DUF2764 family protein [Candidatus Omnitrophica bacterium]|nr:DUF2764 family protein [Candidatus Omnitrophota bacterium]
MPSYYIYFLSSLPTLELGAKPPFSFEELIEKAKDLIPEEDLKIISLIPAILENPSYSHSRGGLSLPYYALKKWIKFDTALRNEFVKIRASRKKLDPVKYTRENGYADPSISRIAITAYRNSSVLDGEKSLDTERWRFLDDLLLGHYFDIDAFIVYAVKLLIIIKQNRIEVSDKTELLERAIT